MYGIPPIHIRYLVNGVSPLLKARISVPFFACPHFYFQEWEPEREEHANKANRKTQIWG